MRKKRTKFTVEYGNRIEYCGSYERAKERVKELSRSDNAPQRIVIKVNGTVAFTQMLLSIQVEKS